MKAVSLILFSLLFLLVFTIPTFAYYDIIPSDDSYTRSNMPTTNYGNDQTIAIGVLFNGTFAFNLSIIPYTETIIGADLFVEALGGTVLNNITVYNTTYFNEHNITYNNQPAIDDMQSSIIAFTNSSAPFFWNASVAGAVNYSHSQNASIYLIVTGNYSPSGVNHWSKEKGEGHEPYLRVYTASGAGCNHTDGRVTGSACLNGTNFYSSDGCNDYLYTCPSGSYCVQLTPQMNVTNDLYENYTSCQIRTNGGLVYNCFNICFLGYVVASNCVEDGCKVCPTGSDGLITKGNITGYFTNTWYSNQSSVSVPSWTVACGFINGTRTYYNETGGVTTEVDILTRAGNTVTEVFNETSGETTTGDSGMDALKSWLNSSMGSSFGADIVSLIVSAVVAVLIFINVGKDNKDPALLMGSFMVSATAFSFIGLLTTWFLVLEVTIIGVMVFLKAKGN